jgi:predicted outer membrane repeat protein
MKKALLFLSWLVLAVPCAGEIIIVDDGGYGDFDNIQAAIDDSNDGDIIYVFPGTYTGPGNRDIDYGGRAITVTGVEPQDPYFVAATIIDCNGSAGENHRGFIFISGEDANSVLAGLTITNGYAIEGGGIYCDSSSPTITNCTLTNNATDELDGYGGGICSIQGEPTIVCCLITANIARSGGGVTIGGGTVDNCTINRNIAVRYGGGIMSSSTNVTQCTVTENTAARGGGLYAMSGLVENCTISGNGADDFGGGIYMSGAPVAKCTITGNSSSNGGGIYNTSDSEITSCVVNSNTATGYGGGIYNWGSISTITNCTISANTAANNGGGVYNTYNDSPTLVNCVLWGNSDSTSCIQDDDPNDSYIAYGGETNHNIDDNPLFLRDPNDGGDGWGTGDNDDFGDLHLQAGSPCVDTGDPYLPILPQEMDIDGQPRLMGGRVDMGADEYLTKMLIVTRPEGGEVWVAGSLHEILWVSDVYEGNVDIVFSANDGNSWQSVESNVADTGGNCRARWIQTSV